MSSLALTDAVLFLVAAWLATRSRLAIGYRLAFAGLAVPALLGFLRFSGLYPLEGWHLLFTLMSASAALPLLAVCVLAPGSVVAHKRQFALIFLLAAMLAGLLISGLGRLRVYDQALGFLSMVAMLVALVRMKDLRRAAGPALMIVGSLLFLAKVAVPPWLAPGDWLHLGMAAGLLLLARAREGAAFGASEGASVRSVAQN